MQPQRFDGTNNTQVRTVVGGDIGSSAGQPVSVGVPLSNLRHTQERSSVASPLTVSNIGGSSYLKKLMVVNPYRTRIQQHIHEPFFLRRHKFGYKLLWTQINKPPTRRQQYVMRL